MVYEMHKKSRFTIRKKILAAFSALILLILCTSIVTLVQINDVNRFSKELKYESQPVFNAIKDISSGLFDSEASSLLYITTRNEKYENDRLETWENISKASVILNQKMSRINNLSLAAQWKDIESLISRYQVDQNDAVKLLKITNQNKSLRASFDYDSLIKKVNLMDTRLEKLSKLIGNSIVITPGTFIGELQSRLNFDLISLENALKILHISQWLLLVFSLILSAIVAIITSRNIVNSIQTAIDVANKIAGGERNVQIQIVSSDEIGDLLKSLSHMHDNIVDTEKKLKLSESKVQAILNDLQVRIKEYRDYISIVSSGDLTKSLSVTGQDDLSQLGEHLNQMTKSLFKIAMEIVTATNQISAGLNQLENAAISQSASASQQATTVTEVSSVMEEIKTTSQQTLDKASTLGNLAEKTHDESIKGQISVGDMNKSMLSLQEKIQKISDTIFSLSDKTQQIGEITNAVSDIAKQSKMLALNAAIEAAKAGEVGKGFSVVAGEVKELAEKSQASTERVQKILQDIRATTERAVIVTDEGTKSVEVSLEHVNNLNKVMDMLGDVIQESSMASKQIVAAVRQESVGIDQIVDSISEIDKVTGEFSSATEQTKSACTNLAEVAQMLKKTVRVYKLSHTDDTTKE